jgi:hypothetical protein
MGQVYSSIFGASHRQLGWLDAQYLRLLKVLFNIVQPKIDRRFTPLKFLKPWYAKLSPTTKLAGPNPYPTAPRDVESFELRAGMACCRAEKGAQRGSREVSQGRCHSYDDFLVFSINMIIGVLFVKIDGAIYHHRCPFVGLFGIHPLFINQPGIKGQP